MNKYETLVSIVEKIRQEAPLSQKRYHPHKTEVEKMRSALARSFIHLFLKVKFGLVEFGERYFKGQQRDWAGYYKGETLNDDVLKYFSAKFRTKMRA